SDRLAARARLLGKGVGDLRSTKTDGPAESAGPSICKGGRGFYFEPPEPVAAPVLSFTFAGRAGLSLRVFAAGAVLMVPPLGGTALIPPLRPVIGPAPVLPALGFAAGPVGFLSASFIVPCWVESAPPAP